MEGPRCELGTPAVGGERLTACATRPPYIGQTSQNFETRYKEHMRHVKNKSVIAAHFWSHKHNCDEEPIDRCQNY